MANGTYLDLQDRAIALGNYGEVDRANLKVFLNMAYSDVQSRHRWSWLESNVDFTVPQGANYVALSTILPDPDSVAVSTIRPNALGLTQPQYVEPVTTDIDSWLNKFDDSTIVGTPIEWTYWNKRIYFYPYTNQSFNYRLYYYKIDSALTTDAQNPLMPVEDRDVLVYGALMYYAMRDHDANRTQFWQNFYEGFIAKMQGKERLLKTQQRVLRVRMPKAYDGVFNLYRL